MTVEIMNPYDGVTIFRGEKIIYADLVLSHQVISTCRVNGGLRSDLSYVANHQICEPKSCNPDGHKRCLAVRNPKAYHQKVCIYHGLPWDRTCLLGTAANMNCAGFSKKSFRELTVACVATAGIETNAGRAGDPAYVYEKGNGFHRIETDQAAPVEAGTINIMIFINQELSKGAMVRSIKMATEAKATVLQELNVASRYSQGLATGTGTDQIAVASLETGKAPLTSAGKHVKLGELLSLAVREGIKEALFLQNKLTPEIVRYVPRLLQRFALAEDELLKALSQQMPEKAFKLLELNRYPIFSDPQLVGQVLAYVHLLDQINWNIIPEASAHETLLCQAALVATSASGKLDSFNQYHWELKPLKDQPLKLLISALAVGLSEKWDVPWAG